MLTIEAEVSSEHRDPVHRSLPRFNTTDHATTSVANFCRNGIILSQPEQSCDERGKTLCLCRVRKSLKGQAFCVRCARRCLSTAHKHNLCKVRRRLRNVSVRRELHASTSSPAKKQLMLGDGREE
jgi:hypothetical protein